MDDGVGTPVVTVHVARFAATRALAAFGPAALSGDRLARTLGATFARWCATTAPGTFTRRHTDLRTWLLVARWADPGAIDGSLALRRWQDRCRETLVLRLRPLHVRGTWDGQAPFPSGRSERSHEPDSHERIVALTRATLNPRTTRAFRRSVPAVAAQAARAAGCLLAFGFGESPLTRQGTFSAWSDARSMLRFAQKTPAHAQVVQRTRAQGWYREELFARFALLDHHGTLGGRDPFESVSAGESAA